jgi:hypothetical protein
MRLAMHAALSPLISYAQRDLKQISEFVSS